MDVRDIVSVVLSRRIFPEVLAYIRNVVQEQKVFTVFKLQWFTMKKKHICLYLILCTSYYISQIKNMIVFIHHDPWYVVKVVHIPSLSYTRICPPPVTWTPS